MEAKPEFPQSLQDAIRYFSDPDVCVEFLASLRWPAGVQCPACEQKRATFLKTRRVWKCKECGRQFSVKIGTILEDSPIPLDKWLTGVWLVVNCKNGISSYELAKDLGVTQKSGWFMLHRIREALKNNSWDKTKLGGPDTIVEVDETFVGGKKRNMHADKKVRYEAKGGAHGKTVVMGILDREMRQVRAKVVPNVKRETLQQEVLGNVKHGTKVFTDEHVGYDNLHSRYVHDVVAHAERYVNGLVHTNGIENFWSLLKRTLSGTYVAVEPFHLDRYIDEQAFRFNNRGGKKKADRITDADRFMLACSQITGKRLTFAELTGKVGETRF
ncbi:MAG TPA: IS1595 family transposase [Terriglobales bacterium]